MQILITGRHVEIPPNLREYIEEKAAKLTRFYDRIHEVEVIVDHEAEQCSIEMIARVERKHVFVAGATGPDALALIDTITGKIERQLTKHKEKNRNHKGGAEGSAAELE